MKKGTNRTEYVVQIRSSGFYDFRDSTMVYVHRQKAIDYVRAARQLDHYEYRLVRREIIEFVEDV